MQGEINEVRILLTAGIVISLACGTSTHAVCLDKWGVGATLFEELKDVLHFSNLAGPTPIPFHLLVGGTVLVPMGISNLAVFENAFTNPRATMNITAQS